MTSTKRKIIIQSLSAVGVLLLLVFVAGVAAGYLEATGADIDVVSFGFVVLGLLAVVLMGGALWVGVRWMQAIDEAAREAHKAAWYWGGSAGMAVGGVLMMLAMLPGAEAVAIPSFLIGRADPVAYAATGAFAMMGLMLIGYIIVWCWWWLARR